MAGAKVITPSTLLTKDVASGYLTVNGGGKLVSVVGSGFQKAAEISGTTFTASEYNTFSVYESVGGWTIDLTSSSIGAASVSGANDVVIGGESGDSISIAAANVTVTGGKGADSIVGTGANANIDAGEDDDIITLTNSANVTVVGGAGNDKISISGASAYVEAGEGDDTVSIAGNSATVNAGEGADSIYVGGNSATISSGDGADTISVAGTDATVNAGAGNDFVSISGKNALVYGEDGDDSITVSDEAATVYGGAGNDSIVVVSKEATIDAGDGNDFVSVNGASNTITLGAGKDTISIGTAAKGATVDAGADADSIVVAGADATITLGDGKDTVSIGATGATLTDYSYTDDTLILGGSKGSSNPSKVKFTSSGVVSVADAKISATVNLTDGYYKAKLSDNSTGDTTQSYAWATDSATTINLSSEKDAFYVVTNDNDEGDLVTGGTGNDSILVGSDDSVVGGKGDDSVSLATGATGVVYGMTLKTGDDTVASGESVLGFDDDDVTLYIDDATKIGATVGTAGLKVSLKGSSVTFNTADSKGTSVGLKINNAGTVVNTQIFSGTAEIMEDAKLVYGTEQKDQNKVSLTGSEDYTIDLGNSGLYGDTRTYANVNIIDASTSNGDNILVGAASDSTTILAGKSSTSLAGSGSKGDSLVGGDGDDTFYYASGWGKDTISGYGAKGDDKLVLSGNITKMKKDANGLVMYFGDTTGQKLTVTNTTTTSDKTGADMIYTWEDAGSSTTYTAKIGYTNTASTLTYTEDAKIYAGGKKADTVKVTGNDDAAIWLGHEYGGYTFKDIEAVDASATTGDVIIWGSESDDTLTAGKGSSTLFGGFGGNDLLKGNSSGETLFYFGKNGGKDTITGGSNSTDVVMLYDVSGSDINYTKTAEASTSSDLNLVLNDGSTLTIKSVSSNVRTFQIADGSKWTWDTSKKTFVAAE